jgi:hypothetical protein
MGTKLFINVCKSSTKIPHFVFIEEKTWEILGKNLDGPKIEKNLLTETTETIGTKLCKNGVCEVLYGDSSFCCDSGKTWLSFLDSD